LLDVQEHFFEVTVVGRWHEKQLSRGPATSPTRATPLISHIGFYRSMHGFHESESNIRVLSDAH
jgi:hypothetical protein